MKQFLFYCICGAVMSVGYFLIFRFIGLDVERAEIYTGALAAVFALTISVLVWRRRAEQPQSNDDSSTKKR